MFKNPRAFVSANLEYSSNEAAVSDKYARFRSNSKLAGAFDVHICSGLQVASFSTLGFLMDFLISEI